MHGTLTVLNPEMVGGDDPPSKLIGTAKAGKFDYRSAPIRSLDASKITEDPLFRPITRHGKMRCRRLSSKAVARIVERYVKGIGLDASHFAGHSVRSGLATSAVIGFGSRHHAANSPSVVGNGSSLYSGR
jgi:hypothetical protein